MSKIETREVLTGRESRNYSDDCTLGLPILDTLQIIGFTFKKNGWFVWIVTGLLLSRVVRDFVQRRWV